MRSKNSSKRDKRDKQGKKDTVSANIKTHLSNKVRSELLRKLHSRIHFGKTHYIIKALEKAYSIDLSECAQIPCDACAWAKAKHRPVAKTRTRPAGRIGERLHYDLFKAHCKSETGCKYLLAVVDDFSGYVWTFGLKEKSETMRNIQILVATIEKLLGKRVDGLVRQDLSVLPGVA